MSLTKSVRIRFRKCLAMVAIVTLCGQPVIAFDTFWHSAATSAAAKQLGFTPDSTNIVQFGNFSGPDFFGPLYDTVLGERLESLENGKLVKEKAQKKLKEFDSFRKSGNTVVVRKFAIFMHFDNLYEKLDSNGKFDYLFLRLLKNTQKTINKFYSDGSLSPRRKKMLILMTLGGSLHMVQDFYSHSDWIHQDFQRIPMPLVRLPWGKDRAPTWFEVREHFAAQNIDPDHWPFKVSSGVYPPPKEGQAIRYTWLGDLNTHTFMNHDNSQLIYDGSSQVKHHNRGPFPASQSASEHQLFAVNTAAGASIEWIQKVMEDSGARSAIEFARDIKLEKRDPMLPFLTSALASTLFMSCVADTWDGPEPPQRRKTECHGSYLAVAPTGAGILFPGAGVPGFYDVTPSPYNEFWAMHTKYNIVEQLAQGFGSQSGQYVFDPNWVKANYP